MTGGREQRRARALQFVESRLPRRAADRRFVVRRWLFGIAPYFVLEAVLDLMCEFREAR